MKSFFNSRRTRYTGAVMLFVWLMSLGIGVANACLVQPGNGWHQHLSHSNAGIASVALTEHDGVSNNITRAYVPTDENIKSPQKIACLNFCVVAQAALINYHTDGLAELTLVPVPFLTRLLLPVPDQTSQLEALGRLTWSEPPVFIHFLRLTI